ncbi:MAG: preprotein translocase subunit SecG [Mangrovibacterium sp.]
MYTLITVLLIIASVFMVLIVLVQNSKGGGLASNFQSSNQVMGVRKTNDFLDKTTWWLAGILLVLSIAGSAYIPKENKVPVATEMSSQINNAAKQATIQTEPVFEEATGEVNATETNTSEETEASEPTQ